MNLRTSPGFWALSMGTAGGLAGFLGPIFLNPDAHQGPLLGLFVTGPGGAIAGLLLGSVFRVLPFSDILRTQALLLCCTLLGVGTLWFCLPEPKVVSRVVDATIEGCRPAGELLPARIAHWEERIAAVSYAAPPRDHWCEDTRRMLREMPGVVVGLRVTRTNSIVQHRRPWDAGSLTALGWKRIGDSRDYFGGGTCASYPRGKQVTLAPRGEGSGKWPPDDLPNFLGLQTLEAVPARYLPLLRMGTVPIS
jgi:hypothetical protein